MGWVGWEEESTELMGVEGGVEGGGSDGGVVTTGVEGCNKLVIAEFWSKFDADREPLDEGAEPLPAEAAE